MKYQCGFYKNIAPLYSRALWIQLDKSEFIDYHFYSSSKKLAGIQTIDKEDSIYFSKNGTFKWLFLRNFYIKKSILFQFGLITSIIKTKYHAYIFTGDMYNIFTWIAAIICKIKNKPVIFWGHGLYGNEGFLKKKARILFYKLANVHLLYGNRAKNIMSENGFLNKNMHVVYNSLDYKKHMEYYKNKNNANLSEIKKELFPINPNLPVICFIGRLTKEKKLHYLLEAIKLNNKRGLSLNCLLVGHGVEYDSLKKLSKELGIIENICFYGASYDENKNAELIMLSDCCVSPGNVGLTAIHSLSLGTPVITHDNFKNQMPEVESIVPDQTGLYFKEDNVEELANSIEKLIKNSLKSKMEKLCISQIKSLWNPINQASLIDKAIINLIQRKSQ